MLSLPLDSTDRPRLPAVPDDAVVAAPAAAGDALQVLDDPQEWNAFSRPDASRAGCVESHLVVQGMTCAACAITIEDALRRVPGVLAAEVSAGSHRARVVWSPEAVLPSRWMQAIQRAGYHPLPANDRHALEQRRSETRQALWRWLVAGLCMMQVMMYAYPAYIAHPGDLSAEMEQLLRWASWVLTLPVILFSCGPFFRSALRDLAQRRVSMDLPVALGMLITFVVSTAGTFNPQGLFGREVFFDSLTMFVFFLLTGRWLEMRLRDRTAGALDAMMNRLPEAVQRRTAEGTWETVAARRLQPGDRVRVLPGQAFPADAVITLGETRVDQSLLTGESRPVARGVGGAVVAGSHNLGAVVEIRVERVGAETRFAEIVALMQTAATSKPRLAQLADRLAKPFLIGVLVAAAGACLYWWPQDPGHALMVAVAVLIVTCPCALSLATPTAMLASAGALARSGVLVRRLQALEGLAGIDTVVFDKTGTLTRDAMQLRDVQLRPGVSMAQALGQARALARHSLHPVARALVQAAQQASVADDWQARGVQEVAGQGLQGSLATTAQDTAGTAFRLGSAAFCGLAAGQGGSAASTHLCDAQGWVASFALAQDVRADAAATVAALRGAGLSVHLLSGDDAGAAAAVAQEVGIDQVHAGCTPDGKLAFVRALQAQGHRVAMVGDGLNDGPVLAAADVSFAFGQAVALAKSQADFVVLGEHLALVRRSLRLATRTMRIVRQNLWWALAYNAACVPLAVAGWLPAWLAGLGMAASSLVVVLNALRLSAGDQQEVLS
ncbi:MAG: cation-translocating P-type ATPase [Rhodoferax sp.]|nr:cation-translocating P-type ATPase [Rhodoferax sp.]